MWPSAWLGPAGPLAGPALTAHGITIGALEVVALCLGLLWTTVNFYHFYPVVQAAVESVADRYSGAAPPAPSTVDEPAPTIDVLLPAYREGAVVEQSIRSVRAADYPQDRIELYVVVEAGDADTRSALADLDDLAFTELAVPAGYPGEPTKPRALNYAFEQTRGDVVGIVDAEDVVGPGLFREAVERLETDCDFVQARLDMTNEGDGWLNTLFRAEYGFWYEVVLPAFDRVGYPMPLSGTSCLFRRSLLVAADVERRERYGETLPRDGRLWTGAYRLFGRTPWDPDNVTEDFELGLFLWEHGFDVGYLASTTDEESPLTLDAWMKQRTRWEKGKVQTLFKYLRTPPRGTSGKVHLFMQSMLPHVGPLNLAGVVVLVVLANLATYDPGTVVGAVLSLGLAFVVLATALFGYGYWHASDAAPAVRIRRLVVVAATLPFYWVLQWVADVRAIAQARGGWLPWERVDHHGRNLVAPTGPTIGEPEEDVLSPGDRYLGLFTVLLVGAVLRFYELGTASLWTDEVYSIAVRGAMSLPGMLVVSGDPHPPLYFVLLHAWMAAAESLGPTPWVARALSAGLSVATIAAVYALGRELFDDRVGLVAAAFVAVSSFHVHHGRTVRMYSLFALLSVASWLFFVRLRRAGRPGTAAYVVSSGAMLYTHAFAAFVLLAQHVYVALSETRGGIPIRRWVRVQVGLVLVASPLLGFLAQSALDPRFDPSSAVAISWIPLPSTASLTGTVLEYVGYPAHYPVDGGSTVLWVGSGAIALGFVAAAVLAIVGYRPDEGFWLSASWRNGQLAALLAVPLGAPFVLSHVVAPIYAPRYTLPASIGLAILAAAGLMNVPGKRHRRAAIGVLLVGSAALTGAYFAADTVQDWQIATTPIERQGAPGDLLVLQPDWIEASVDFYYDGPAMDRVTVPAGALSSSTSTELRTGIESHDRVWVIASHGSPSPDLRSQLRGRPRTVVYDEGIITVERYDPPPSEPAGQASSADGPTDG